MTRFEALTVAIKTGGHDLTQYLASLPMDKATLADMAAPLVHGLETLPWCACYLLAAIVAKSRHNEIWLVYCLMAIKQLLAGH
jgi:hypothetical protein